MSFNINYIPYAGIVLCSLVACNTLKNSGPGGGAYIEKHRSQFHFSPAEKWMNDPNGLVYYEGEYHLFYQYYPDSTVWGPMHWGHAVSRNLVQWQHLPVALYPDQLGMIFSGSAVVDWNNTSGFGKDGRPPLVAIYTQHLMAGEKAGRHDFQYQSIAYSTDKGRTWTKYAGNPVIPNPGIHDFRDPKVMWDKESKQWVMVFAAGNHVKLWGSPDLKHWTHLSDFGREWGSHGGVWECPDLFPVRVDGTGETRWVLLLSINPGAPNGGSGTQYFVGQFDGKNFVPDPGFSQAVSGEKAVWLDYGRDNYAGVTWSDVPASDGRRLFLGWMSNWDYAQVVPTATWRSAMTLPRSLQLKNTNEGFRLFSEPVRELQNLRERGVTIPAAAIDDGLDLSTVTGFRSVTKELVLEFEWNAADPVAEFGVELYNGKGEKVALGYDPAKQQLFVDRTQSGPGGFSPKFLSRDVAPYVTSNQRLHLHLLIDAASVEMFADNGARVMTDIFFPTEDFTGLRVYGKGVRVASGKAWELKKAW
ncbi:MAG: glycoside hydrolase family 32 protein [Lewinellaceae bacterium]|nr:glycoside hydrolase family 32 protein [Lewinellaceae bacterium]